MPESYMLHRLFIGGREGVEALLGTANPDLVFWAGVGYVAFPLLLGTGVGLIVASRRPWPRRLARVAVGRNPARRAWDALFSSRPGGVVRLRLKSDRS